MHTTEERRLLDEGLKLFPSFFKLWLMLGQLEERLGNLEQAKEAYESGLKHCSSCIPLWLSLANLEEKMNGLSKARAVLTMARKKNAQNPELWLAAVKLEFENHEPERARMLLAKARERGGTERVLFPLIASQLEHAVDARVARGRDSLLHPIVLKIRNTIETVLLWPSSDGDEVSKAQHGCIDCLAVMICTELQALESFRDLTSKNTSLVRMDSCSRDAAMRDSVRSYVIHQLTPDKDCTYEASISMSFVLCMANVLISACQKIPDSCKRPFAREILPRLIQSVEVMMESEYRAAGLQVFFSAVYHLKSTILPYTFDLLKVSLKSLREGLEKEKMAGAKLMASLMASEEAIVNSIAGGLLEAITVLSSLSSSDPSPDVKICLETECGVRWDDRPVDLPVVPTDFQQVII
ncbi:hypothetical protein TEA_017595 [Camellia sinensis var. sinensis]|uniref:Uncharacterized protein n=1 Tax=Camellia sinensis var. sinensis TaxID=542762 RepID=A0A4S4D661_CAMSN|nr:hypothetical protein TEA_017595 [Camellia sinensis var. sinensis]